MRMSQGNYMIMKRRDVALPLDESSGGRNRMRMSRGISTIVKQRDHEDVFVPRVVPSQQFYAFFYHRHSNYFRILTSDVPPPRRSNNGQLRPIVTKIPRLLLKRLRSTCHVKRYINGIFREQFSYCWERLIFLPVGLHPVLCNATEFFSLRAVPFENPQRRNSRNFFSLNSYYNFVLCSNNM